jgi:hypothetical protein
VPLPGLPEPCEIERATRPEVLFTPRWLACEAQPEGCQRLLLGFAREHSFTRVAWHDGERGYFRLVATDVGDRRITILARTDGAAVAAWREMPGGGADLDVNCSVRLGLGGGYAALDAHYFDGRDRSRNQERIYHAPIHEIGQATEPIGEIAGLSSSPQHLAVSAELVALEMQPASFVQVIRATGEQRSLINDPVLGIPQNVTVVGDHVMWEDWPSPVRVAHGSMLDDAAFFHSAEPGDVIGFHTDGVDLAWMQAYQDIPGDLYERIELWTAPYVRDAADLAPRLVRPLATAGPDNFGGGWYAWQRNDPARLEVYSIADGTRRVWYPPTGVTIQYEPLYVTDHEILLIAGGDRRFEPLWRLDPHALPVVE